MLPGEILTTVEFAAVGGTEVELAITPVGSPDNEVSVASPEAVPMVFSVAFAGKGGDGAELGAGEDADNEAVAVSPLKKLEMSGRRLVSESGTLRLESAKGGAEELGGTSTTSVMQVTVS